MSDATYIDSKQFYKDMCAKHFLEIKRLEKELRGRLTLEAEVERLKEELKWHKRELDAANEFADSFSAKGEQTDG